MDVNLFLNYKIFSNTVYDFLYAIILFLCIAITIFIAKFLIKRFFHVPAKNENLVKHFWVKSSTNNLIPLLYLGAFYLSMDQLNLNLRFETIIGKIFLFLVIFYICNLLSSFISFITEKYFAQFEAELHSAKLVKVFRNLLKSIIWFVGLLLFLDNANIKFAGFLTGLGIGGIALAFLAQSVLKDALSYFSIHID